MPEKAYYSVGGEEFSNKSGIETRCRHIMASIADGQTVSNEDIPFLIELFQNHDEWAVKSSKGVKRIIVQKTGEYATRCFVLVLADESKIDISFKHAVRLLRGERTRALLPRKLLDYKSAARTAITDHIRAFRDAHLALNITCPFSGELIIRSNSAVDHEPPCTFDRLLYDFTDGEKINPLEIAVGSLDGTTAYFESGKLSANWIDYHRLNAKLRLLSRIGHAQVSAPRINWNPLIYPQKKL